MRTAARTLTWLRAPTLPAALAACLLGGACSEAPPPAGQGGAGPGSAGATSVTTTYVSAVSGFGGAPGELPRAFTVTGVVTDGAAPVEGAIVMQAGGEPALVTGPDGAFSIEITRDIPGQPTVVAAKIGYRTDGIELEVVPDGPVELTLRRASPPDNALGYSYGDPGDGDPHNSTRYCDHCHTTLVAQFLESGHARSARSPLLQAIYAGVSMAHADEASCSAAGGRWKAGRVPGSEGGAAMRCYLGSGVLPDLNASCGGGAQPSCDDPALPAAARPAAFGACADCHAAGIDGPAGGRELLEATGIAFEKGDHCDACHKIRDVDLSKPPGVAGALIVQRPQERISTDPSSKLLEVMFGPRPDVPNRFMGGSYQPKFSASELCGGCHEQRQAALLPGAALDPGRWPDGLPIHQTFSEWAASSWNRPASQCQACHMPGVLSLKSSLDVTTEANASVSLGFVRPAGTVRSHAFRGPLEGSPPLIRDAVEVRIAASAASGELAVTVSLAGSSAGHAVPTGEPMRALVLLVTAEACGAPLSPSSGMTVNDTGGALAEARVGQGAGLTGAELAWEEGAARARAGDVVRIVRPTGAYDDYTGIGRFADPSLDAADKGLEIRAPVGEARVVAAGGGAITLSGAIPAQEGDLVYLGAPLPAAPVDGQPAAAFAGAAGYTFAKVLVDPAGARHAPQHRAVDIASDNRIAPGSVAVTSHGFAIPAGCAATANVTATLLYRPVPLALAKERGASAHDYMVASASSPVPLD
ncbi:carboxypeptidase-like regulatory domain-containing protein [Sorangium sp. So ce1000]|uniref:carboxypeptidase-like regulatory domain-containing protein n=1 Tax=Sorangium sp. So ce1000 TaxID=3133325 RepID=UPI003F648B7C